MQKFPMMNYQVMNEHRLAASAEPSQFQLETNERVNSAVQNLYSALTSAPGEGKGLGSCHK